MSIFRDLMWFFKLEKNSYIKGALLLIAVSILNLIPPYIVGRTIDSIQNDTLTRNELIKWISIIILIGLIMYISRYLWRIMIFGSAIRLGKLLRNKLYKHFTIQSPEFYNQKRIGDLMAHSTNDIQAVELTAGEGILTLVDSITMGSLVIITMAVTISWQLTIVSLLPMPLMIYLTNRYADLIHQHFFKAQEAFSNLNNKVQESISGIRVTKAFGQEDEEIEEFKNESVKTVKKNIAVAKVDALFDPTIQLIVGLSFFLAISFGSYLVVNEELTIGQLTSFTVYLGLLIWPMLAFGMLFNIVERGRASYDRINNLLAIKPKIVDKENSLKNITIKDIQFKISQFNYPNKTQFDLKNINFKLRKGQTLGIVGKTGSGKTTLLRLLTREFDLTNGDILINNNSIKDLSLDSLRSNIAYVPQDQFLFSDTISNNISFAKPDAKYSEIRYVAKMACIDEEILNFTNGYETIIGEKGVTLSGGQKQRIAIARALLMNGEILILDDAVSAIDAKTEEKIQKNLITNRANKTTLIASHRISTVKHADLIIVLDNGQIVEQGNHVELIKLDGWYKQMYLRQQLETLVERGETDNE